MIRPHVQVFWKHKCFGNIGQLETRPLIGFKNTYASKTLAHDRAPNVLKHKNAQQNSVTTLYPSIAGRVLVARGQMNCGQRQSGVTYRKYEEVIDLIGGHKYSVWLDGKEIEGAVGGLLNNKLLFCGGPSGPPGPTYGPTHGIQTRNGIQTCQILGQPNNSFQSLEGRDYASSVVLNQSKLWITGGQTLENSGGGCCWLSGSKNSTEFISLDQPPYPGPDLPFEIHGHCMVQVCPNTIYIIGGCQNDKNSTHTWIVDPTNNFDIKSGPPLNRARLGHSCNKMKINGKYFLVVAGGLHEVWHEGNKKEMKSNCSVELLDTTSPDKGWILGRCMN